VSDSIAVAFLSRFATRIIAGAFHFCFAARIPRTIFTRRPLVMLQQTTGVPQRSTTRDYPLQLFDKDFGTLPGVTARQ
jgi:hypothetical protein